MTTEIDWTRNCLTDGIHHGREEAIWQLPLRYATQVFGHDVLKKFVIERIHQDALQIAELGLTDADTGVKLNVEWANEVRDKADEFYRHTLQRKVGEISTYYNGASFKRDMVNGAQWFADGKLNPGWEPMHPHDTVNMLCRILGQGAKYNVRPDVKARVESAR